MREKQSFQISLLFMAQFFLFFLTPWPIVELEACWKGPPFILISACALLKPCPQRYSVQRGYYWNGGQCPARSLLCPRSSRCPILGRPLLTWFCFPGTGHPSSWVLQADRACRGHVVTMGLPRSCSSWKPDVRRLAARRVRRHAAVLSLDCVPSPGPSRQPWRKAGLLV